MNFCSQPISPQLMKNVSLLILGLAGLLPGQASEREMRFLAWDEAVAEQPLAVVSGDSGDRRTEIENLHPLRRSEPVKARPVEGRLGLVALDHDDPESARFSVAIPEADGQLLVLLVPDSEAPSGLRGFAIQDSPEDFPWGSFRVINATDRPVIMRLGEEVKLLPAGFKPVDFDAPPDGNHPVLLAARDEPERPVYSSVWTADAEARRLVIIVPGQEVRLGRVALKVIPESRLEAREAPDS